MGARKKKDRGGLLLLGAAAIGAAFLLGAKKPPVGGGPAVPGGSIGSVAVSQRAPMGSHLVSKDAGATVNVAVAWTPNTKDAAGNPIKWPYFFDFILTEKATGIVRASGGLGAVEATSGAQAFNGPFNLSAPPAGAYDLKVILFGAASDAAGRPRTGVFALLGELTHANAIQATGVAASGWEGAGAPTFSARQ
jgi:hypothetical protein